ncbi:MAG: hypothetical protein IH624_12000 [Phycisphaerae bacterium]|nr:hypothetical protein [Phycisphaerae bacterium]
MKIRLRYAVVRGLVLVVIGVGAFFAGDAFFTFALRTRRSFCVDISRYYVGPQHLQNCGVAVPKAVEDLLLQKVRPEDRQWCWQRLVRYQPG